MPEPGWYTDPYDDQIARWHDGTSWTSHSMVKSDWKGQGMPPPPGQEWRPGPLPQPPAPRAPQRPAGPVYRQPWFLVAAAVLVVGAVVGVLATRDDGDPKKVTVTDPKTGETSKVTVRTLTAAKDVAAALSAAGFACTGYADEVPSEDDIDFGIDDPSNGTGTCDHDGTEVTLSAFDDTRHLAQWRRLGETMGCSFGEAFGMVEFNYAYGDLWGASVEDNLDRDTVAAIAKALGGKTATVKCDS